MIKPVKQIRNVTIESLHNGYIIRVGCQTFVLESADAVVANLRSYLANPDKVESETLQAYQELNKENKVGPLTAASLRAYAPAEVGTRSGSIVTCQADAVPTPLDR
jgi:hypothetical protein